MAQVKQDQAGPRRIGELAGPAEELQGLLSIRCLRGADACPCGAANLIQADRVAAAAGLTRWTAG